MTAELGTPGDQDGPMDGQAVASVAENEVATFFALINVCQTLIQGHRGWPEKWTFFRFGKIFVI